MHLPQDISDDPDCCLEELLSIVLWDEPNGNLRTQGLSQHCPNAAQHVQNQPSNPISRVEATKGDAHKLPTWQMMDVWSPRSSKVPEKDSGSELKENRKNLHQFSKEQLSEVNHFLNDLTGEASENVRNGNEKVRGPDNCWVVAVYMEGEENAIDGWSSSWFFKWSFKWFEVESEKHELRCGGKL